ncbi:TetR family transcriptional regulator [Streptomyces sp. DH37]|uniref:TetR/AcrR family transcriptional regulator n=1 Tax=Streptomyces sp. DH37 TaxID=3040122 RepID=UPI0024431329|nr:TetR family transcriptional regulator [Streptomyces sp. DH37]MDG9704392.1 TetR family transcriptional regulator [Streptomyces sp. DH37]
MSGREAGARSAGSGARPARRRGRPTSADRAAAGEAARDRILASARAEFAERGYDKASIRSIARGAEVDPALVHHYFGTKEQVFGAAVEVSFAPVGEGLDNLAPRGPGDLGDLGRQLVRFFLGVWEDPATRAPLLAVVRSALNNETAARILRGMVTRQLMARVAQGLDAPDRELRVELAAAQLVGTAILRYVVGVEPLASADPEELAARLAPVVQHHLTGPAGAPEAPEAPGAPGPAGGHPRGV